MQAFGTIQGSKFAVGDLESVSDGETAVPAPNATAAVSGDIAAGINDEEKNDSLILNIDDDDSAATIVAKGKLLMAKAKVLAKPLPLSAEKQRALEERCWRLRVKIIEARLYRHSDDRFGLLLGEAEALHPNKAALAASGLGILFKDKSVWPSKHWERSRSLLEKWQSSPRDGKCICTAKPFRGKKAAVFLKLVDTWKKELYEVDEKKCIEVKYKMAPIFLMDVGVPSDRSLAYADAAEATECSHDLTAKAILQRMIQRATLAAELKHRTLKQQLQDDARFLARSGGKAITLSAKSLAESLDTSKVLESGSRHRNLRRQLMRPTSRRDASPE